MIEESYEFIQEVDINSKDGMCEELGDVLLQVLLHSQIAKDEGEFTIEDVTVHKELIVSSVNELFLNDRTKLIVQKGTYIDLTTSGSILVAGKTRSGKTTGIISLLLQVLKHGKDDFNSSVIIIDPKKAELSQLPHTVTVDDNGEAIAILKAIRQFADNVTKRQQILNELSKKKGDAVK